MGRFFVLLSILAIAFLSSACQAARGRFGFTTADNQELSPLEKKFFVPQRFKTPTRTPLFEREDVIWYAYTPHSPNIGAYYGISLQKKSLGFQEIDLRNHTLQPGQSALIDSYRNLEEGEYKLKIALANKIIDEVDFIVVDASGEDAIDFEKDEPELTSLDGNSL